MQAFLRQLTSRPLPVPRLVHPFPQRSFATCSLLRPRFQTYQPIALRSVPSNSCLRTRESRWIALTHHRWLSTPSRPLLRHYVTPKPLPSRQFLGFLNKIPHNAVFYGIIGLNCLVFGMWFMAIQKYKQERDPSAVTWMQANFTNSWHNLKAGRFWTVVTACFSHRDWAHILFNGFTFFFMAQPVLNFLGSRQFIFLYLGGGLVSCITGMTYANWTGKYDYASHGASGAIYSIIALLACVAPTMTFQLYGIIPIPAWLAVTGLFSYDLYSTISNKSGTTDTVGHVGGMLAGVGYFLLRRFRVF